MPGPPLPYRPPAGAQVAPGHPLARNLVGLWPLNEGSGAGLSNAAPGASSRYRLTLGKNSSNAITPWGAGPFGVAPAWDTVAGNPGWYAGGPLLSTRKAGLSFGCWFRTAAATNPGASYLMFNGAAGSNGWGFYHSDGAGSAGNKLSIILDGVSFAATTAMTIAADTTYHAVATCDLANRWSLYINGLLFSGPTVNASTATPTGGFGLAASSAGSFTWQGWLALPFVVERCLAAPEVRDLYLNSAALFAPPGRWARRFVAAAGGGGAGGPWPWFFDNPLSGGFNPMGL